MKQVWTVYHDDGWWAEVPGDGDLVAFSDTRAGLDAAIDLVLAQRQRGRPMSRCTDTCKKPTPAQAHCSLCHVTFGGVRGFDIHRRGGDCSNPSSFGYVERDQVWREPMDHEKVAAFREHVKGTRGRGTMKS